MNIPKIARRGRDINEANRVATPLELLLDLTFVVGIAAVSAQLHHGVMEQHTGPAVAGYLLAFAAIWWAWMNYSWFASAYDNDDTLFRVLTMVQMGGVLVLATGVPGVFTFQFTAGVVGYVIMRLALCIQWLRVARADPLRRRTCLRYAVGVMLVQVGWVIFLLVVRGGNLTGHALWTCLILLWAFELAVPIWAERAGATPWHAHHIAERYGGMVIIVLGECVLGATNAIANMWQTDGWSFDLALIGFSGTLLIFSLWSMYFLMPTADAIHHHRARVWGWGYGHFIIFASIAAVGSGLEVVADVLKSTHDVAGAAATAQAVHGVSPLYAVSMVALAESIFVVALWGLYQYVVRLAHWHLLPVSVCLAGIALGPIAVALGLPLPWGMLLLAVGPLPAIAYHEKERRRGVDHVAGAHA